MSVHILSLLLCWCVCIIGRFVVEFQVLDFSDGNVCIKELVSNLLYIAVFFLYPEITRNRPTFSPAFGNLCCLGQPQPAWDGSLVAS